MGYGIKLYGLNNSLPISSLAPTMVFRGKATRIGTVYYPANDPGTALQYTVGQPGEYYLSEASSGTAGYSFVWTPLQNIYYGGGSCYSGAGINYPIAWGNVSKDIAIATYTITCPDSPLVFICATDRRCKGSVLSVVQNGTSGGVPVWNISTSVTFAVGMSEADIFSGVTLYCFSKIISSDNLGGYGIAAYDANGNLTYCSDKKILRIKDYVTISGATNPTNIADMIYDTALCPNPETRVYSLAKPSFMNMDFARYNWRQFVVSWYKNIGNQCAYAHRFRLYLDNQIITSGANVNQANNEIVFGLSVAKAKFYFEYYDFIQSNNAYYNRAPDGTTSITSRSEVFTYTVPIIEGADYD